MKYCTKHIILAGAAPDTGNHGVTALCHSTVRGLQSRGIKHVTLLDYGQGLCPAGDARSVGQITINNLPYKAGKRLYRSDNIYNIRARQMLGLSSPVLSAVEAADAVLDVSGGDSFTDLYGRKRFDQVLAPKVMALAAKKPLILLPQTYGPFRSRRARKIARSIISRACLAFARDKKSLDALCDLLGNDFDSDRHLLGVDLAFGLPAPTITMRPLNRWVGINVSGLLWNNPSAASQQFGLTCDYRGALMQVLHHILRTSPCQIVLLPHVTPNGGEECDLRASYDLKRRMPADLQDFIKIEETAKTPSDLKGVIAGLDWFAGARMHATIAALSTRVPVANMAYSVKAQGVFDLCGAGDQVFDMRVLQTPDLVRSLILSFESRHTRVKALMSALPGVERRWRQQMDRITSAVQTPIFTADWAYAC